MIVNTILHGYIWRGEGVPDNDVHSSILQYAQIGDFYVDENDFKIYRCTEDQPESQVWEIVVNQPEVEAMIVAAIAGLPQADWAQTINTEPDYIKNKPSLSAVATSGSYNDLSNKPSIPAAQIQSDCAQSNNAIVDYIKNKPSLAAVATSGAYADLSGKPSLATVATSGSYNDLSNKPSIPAAQVQSDWTQTNNGAVDFIKNKPAARSQSSASRSLNSAFQISSTRDSLTNYSVDVSTTATLLGGQTGTVFLEIADDSGFTTNVQELTRFVNGNTVSLAIAITVTQNVTGTLTGYVPAGKYVRLRTANTTGSPTFNYRSGQEVLL